MKPKIFAVDDQKVINALQELEFNTALDGGYSYISGGFAKAEIFNYDDEYFDIELKSGIQNDCQNSVETEQLKMNRITLKIE